LAIAPAQIFFYSFAMAVEIQLDWTFGTTFAIVEARLRQIKIW
jgi:hypothetical protein